jgi:uncharacterized protein (TIGR03086 family)
MTEAEKRYQVIADGFADRVKAVADDQWSAISPCTDWTAAGVVAHVIDTHYRILTRVNEGDPVEADPEGDLPAQWSEARSELEAALADPERATKMSSGMFGEQSFETVVSRLVCTDTLVHTWDLARAAGLDEQLDPESVAAGFGFLEPMDDKLRVPGGFAPKVEPADGADEQTRFLNFCGRKP